MKKILIVLDGAGDLPVKALGGKTPLEVANTSNLDYLAKNGKMGYMYPISEKVVPGSDNALITLFGNDPRKCRRGIYEAVGAGLSLSRGDLAIRTNFGTIDDLKSKGVIDRRAGRNLTSDEARELADVLNKKVKLGRKFEFKSTVQHRGVLVIRGGLSDNVSNIDNEWGGKDDGKFRYSRPLDESANSEYTANLLNDFVDQSFKILKNHNVNFKRAKKGLKVANMVFMRGIGSEIPKMKSYRSWMSINSMPLEIGIAKLSGMKVFSFELPKMKSRDIYGHLHRKLEMKIKFAIKTIKENHEDFIGCYLHFKETDVPGHDNRPLDKKKMLEIIDKKFFGFLRKFVEKNPIKVVVTSDHSTPCELKKHSSDPVPVLVYPGDDDCERFCEKEAKKGSLGKIYGKDFLKKTGLNG
ncbi:phosphoglycerate mutase [Candidatus Pacearchaeota archaeon]|nr:phosphoglycerate mutase [Candidatus Pacearchaeota archaeon]|tara:strand:+ start:2930 stop:4162 length:1233 start_codon:yes stop_codon:yes gene_type:complete